MSSHQQGRVHPSVVHVAVDKRAEPMNPAQRKVVNDLVHANDFENPAEKFKRSNPYWGPTDHTDEALKALEKVFPPKK